MTASIPVSRPDGTALWQRVGGIFMDIILHLGAHRTATTTFQHYLRDQTEDLAAEGVTVWGPERMRGAIVPGLFRSVAGRHGRNIARRAEGRVRMFTRLAQAEGTRQLLVTDENLLGTCIQNFRAGQLYPAAGERMARLGAGMGGQVRRIVLSIRSQDLWWASAAALIVSRGHPVPDARRCEAISRHRRGWRDVITDLACALPGAEIVVLPFESCAGRPDATLGAALGRDAPRDASGRWLNRSLHLSRLRMGLVQQGADPDLLPDGDGRWQPFAEEQAARLKELYADDMHWLVAGADGLATLTEDKRSTRAGTTLPAGALTRGQDYDKGHMAQHG